MRHPRRNLSLQLSTLVCVLCVQAFVAAAQTSETNVAPADLAKLKPSDFTDDELDLPYYLANFQRVANAIPVEGELRGWITSSVWRGNSNQRTYNARVLES